MVPSACCLCPFHPCFSHPSVEPRPEGPTLTSARLPRRQTNQRHPSPASPLAHRGARSPSAFNEVWVSVHIMEAEMEKSSGSLLQKQLSTEVSSWELPGESTSLLMPGNSDRNSGRAGRCERGGEKWNVFTDSPCVVGSVQTNRTVLQPGLSNPTPDPSVRD